MTETADFTIHGDIK